MAVAHAAASSAACRYAALLSQERPCDAADLARHILLHVSLYPDDWQRWLTMAGFADLQPSSNQTFDESIVVLYPSGEGRLADCTMI